MDGVRPKFLAASEKQLAMCRTASSMWPRRAQSSVNSSSVMSSSTVFVCVRRRQKLNTLAVCSETDVDAI